MILKKYVYMSRESIEDCMRFIGYSNKEIEKIISFAPRTYDRFNKIILGENETLFVDDISN